MLTNCPMPVINTDFSKICWNLSDFTSPLNYPVHTGAYRTPVSTQPSCCLCPALPWELSYVSGVMIDTWERWWF